MDASLLFKKEKPKKITLKELYDLYVVENYSMDLVARVTCIPLVPLSRIFQKYHLPERKDAYYMGRVSGEKTKLTDVDTTVFLVPEEDEDPVSAEDLFFSEY